MKKSLIGEVLREERERLGLSQLEVATAIHVDRSLISHWERGTMRIPHEMACKVIKALRSHKLRAQVCFECEASALTMPYLDLVDQHPVVVISVLAEELEEAKVVLLALKLNNKRTDSDLAPRDREAMEHAGEQIVDLLAGIQTILASWHEWYGFDVDRQAIKGYEKLFQRGYATRQRYKAFEHIA